MGVAFKGHDAVAAYLLTLDCDVDTRNRAGQTALMMAALFGRAAQVEMLLAAGADPEIADRAGNTALGLARQQGNEIMAALLNKRAR